MWVIPYLPNERGAGGRRISRCFFYGWDTFKIFDEGSCETSDQEMNPLTEQGEMVALCEDK